MSMARLAQTRSTCLRRQVGAVLVVEQKIISTGYNGAPKGLPHCTTCLREELKIPPGTRYELCRSIHAEANAIVQAAYLGVATKGAVIYISTSYPCIMCARMIVNAGIKLVICDSSTIDENGALILEQAGIQTYFLRSEDGS